MRKSAPPADFFLANHFSLFTLTPLTDAAKQWADQNLQSGCRLGRARAVEPRYIAPIIEGINDAGLTIA